MVSPRLGLWKINLQNIHVRMHALVSLSFVCAQTLSGTIWQQSIQSELSNVIPLEH